MHRLILICVALALTASLAGADEAKPAWDMVKTEKLDGLTVQLSKPVLVSRSKGYLWFATLMSLSSGELLAMLNNYEDDVVNLPTGVVCWSGDGGLTWSQPKQVLYGDSNFRLPSGDHLILPYNLYNGPDNSLKGHYQIVSKGQRDVKVVKDAVRVTGLPRADKPYAKRGVSGFVFNGSGVELKDGNYLASFYGYFKDAKRLSLVMADSKDGILWKYRATVADENCKLAGPDGPSEAATCRLKDGRLMCIFRLGAGNVYGQTFSNDEGKTWSEPLAMKDVFSVQPCLVVLKNGTVVLSGGRPGQFIWFNTAGDGKAWQKVNVTAHHNATQSDEPIRKLTTDEHANTTCYSRIVPTADNALLYIYDRVPNGWHKLPRDTKETNSVWVVRVVVQ